MKSINRYGQVEIVLSEKTSFWYSKRIGLLFWVIPFDDRSYQVMDDPNWHGLIRKSDCKVVYTDRQ